MCTHDIPTYVHMFIHANSYMGEYAYIHTYMHTYIHACIYMYLPTYIFHIHIYILTCLTSAYIAYTQIKLSKHSYTPYKYTYFMLKRTILVSDIHTYFHHII